jgi:hypothetical protein
MDDKKGGRTCTRLKWQEVTREEKDESQPGDEREYPTKMSLQVKPHEASVAVTEEVWHDHTSIA